MRRPDGGVGGLFAGTEEKQPVGREHAMDVAEQLLACLLREIEHDVAQEDDIEALRSGREG
jgi:hypothetical protein